MTLDQLVKELKKSGCNSKQTVIDMLSTKDVGELFGLKADVQHRINHLLSDRK